MEYFNGIKCVSAAELMEGDDPILSKSAYGQYLYRYPHVRVRRGSPAGPALLAWEALRDDIKAKVIEKLGDPDKVLRKNVLTDLIVPDYKAAQFYASCRYLDFPVQLEYTTNAIILNAINRLVNLRGSKARALGNTTKKLWPTVAQAVSDLDKTKYPHTLPANPVRLRDKLKYYLVDGYPSLVHRGYGNANSRKVNDQIERLLLSIYCMQNLPFGEWVHDYYLRFIAGQLEIVDAETGVLYDRRDFYSETKGTYVTISRATVWNVLNNPQNKIIIDRLRNNRIDHITQQTPFNQRTKPVYSLSKISMDDRTFSRKTIDGKWFNAYVAFDVLSGAILGSVTSPDKPSIGMVWECFRDMYRTLDNNQLMWPGEVEIENHLMKDIEDELRMMFTFVTFTTPGLSRSKRAEHLIRAKKYGDEKRNQVGIGRWNGKGAYKTKSESKDEDYKQPRLSIAQLNAEERESVARYNNALHPDQDKFPGKTRWQVLVENVNPDLGRPQKYKLFRYLGLATSTTLRNNDHVRVQYENYAIDSFAIIKNLKANNYAVTAYYVPGVDGQIDEVYLYQGDTFLSRASLVERYNEAKIERTEHDEAIRTRQAKRQANFFRLEKEGVAEKITRHIDFVTPASSEAIKSAAVDVIDDEMPAADSIEDLMTRYTGDYYSEKAISDI